MEKFFCVWCGAESKNVCAECAANESKLYAFCFLTGEKIVWGAECACGFYHGECKGCAEPLIGKGYEPRYCCSDAWCKYKEAAEDYAASAERDAERTEESADMQYAEDNPFDDCEYNVRGVKRAQGAHKARHGMRVNGASIRNPIFRSS